MKKRYPSSGWKTGKVKRSRKQKRAQFKLPKPNPNEPVTTGEMIMDSFVQNHGNGSFSVYQDGRNVTADVLAAFQRQGIPVQNCGGGDMTLNVADDMGMVPQPIDYQQPETPVQNQQPFHNSQLGVDGDMVPQPVL